MPTQTTTETKTFLSGSKVH